MNRCPVGIPEFFGEFEKWNFYNCSVLIAQHNVLVAESTRHWRRKVDIKLQLVFRKNIQRRINAFDNCRGLYGGFRNIDKNGDRGRSGNAGNSTVLYAGLYGVLRRKNDSAGFDAILSQHRRHIGGVDKNLEDVTIAFRRQLSSARPVLEQKEISGAVEADHRRLERKGEGTRRGRRVPLRTTLVFTGSIADQGRATVRRSPDFSRITTRWASN